MALQRKHQFSPKSSAKIHFFWRNGPMITRHVVEFAVHSYLKVLKSHQRERKSPHGPLPDAGLFWARAPLDAADRSQLCEQRRGVASRWTEVRMDLWAFRINWANKPAKLEISSFITKPKVNLKINSCYKSKDVNVNREASGVQTLWKRWIQTQKQPAAVTMIDMHTVAPHRLRRRLD